MTWWQKKPFVDAIHAYDKISDREQKIVLLTIVSLLLVLGFVAIVEPLLLANKSLYEEQRNIQSINAKTTLRIEETLFTQHQDPNDKLRKNLSELNIQANGLQSQIGLLTQALVAPKQMVRLLENVLTQDKQLKLISLSNLPEQGMNINEMGREESSKELSLGESGEVVGNVLLESEPDYLIYKHGFEVELEATYDSSTAYMKRLDNLPWQLFWQSLKYESTQYPKGSLKIRIYTLSMSKAVLGV
jgi:MSHA biogenesis protein MshJ